MAPPEANVCTACVGEPAQETAPATKDQQSSLYEVPLTAQGSGHRTEVAAGTFTVVLDAGRALGGQESGPSPVQAFVSSIVGCSQVSGGTGWLTARCRSCTSAPAIDAPPVGWRRRPPWQAAHTAPVPHAPTSLSPSPFLVPLAPLHRSRSSWWRTMLERSWETSRGWRTPCLTRAACWAAARRTHRPASTASPSLALWRRMCPSHSWTSWQVGSGCGVHAWHHALKGGSGQGMSSMFWPTPACSSADEPRPAAAPPCRGHRGTLPHLSVPAS